MFLEIFKLIKEISTHHLVIKYLKKNRLGIFYFSMAILTFWNSLGVFFYRFSNYGIDDLAFYHPLPLIITIISFIGSIGLLFIGKSRNLLAKKNSTAKNKKILLLIFPIIFFGLSYLWIKFLNVNISGVALFLFELGIFITVSQTRIRAILINKKSSNAQCISYIGILTITVSMLILIASFTILDYRFNSPEITDFLYLVCFISLATRSYLLLSPQ
jgi:hypothetical protein